MKAWHYIAFWLVMFIAARFFLVNPLLNVFDRVEHHLYVIADLLRNR